MLEGNLAGGAGAVRTAAARRGPLVAGARGKFKGLGRPGRGAAGRARRVRPCGCRSRPGTVAGHCLLSALCRVGAGSGGRGSSSGAQGVALAAAGCAHPAGAGRYPGSLCPSPLLGVSGCLGLLLDPLLVRASGVLGEGISSLPGSAIVPGEPAGSCCPSRL